MRSESLTCIGGVAFVEYACSAKLAGLGQKGAGKGSCVVLISKIGEGMVVLGASGIKKSKTSSAAQKSHKPSGKIKVFHGKPRFFLVFFGLGCKVAALGGSALGKSSAIVRTLEKIGCRQMLHIGVGVHHHGAKEDDEFAFFLFFLPIVKDFA